MAALQTTTWIKKKERKTNSWAGFRKKPERQEKN